MQTVLHPDEVFEHFQLGVWSTFLNTSKPLLINIVLHTFRHFCFNCLRCSFEQNTRKVIVCLRRFSDNFFFFIQFRGITFFWGGGRGGRGSITFEHYHFQSRFDPDNKPFPMHIHYLIEFSTPASLRSETQHQNVGLVNTLQCFKNMVYEILWFF